MDNATFHQIRKVITLIETAGHRLEYRPIYSPDLNPIEQKWAQAKAKAKPIHRAYQGSIDELFQGYLL